MSGENRTTQEKFECTQCGHTAKHLDLLRMMARGRNGYGVSMREKVVREKALCYVVRDGRLLVFRHVDFSYEEVGIQVPAGSIREARRRRRPRVLQAGQGALIGRLFD